MNILYRIEIVIVESSNFLHLLKIFTVYINKKFFVKKNESNLYKMFENLNHHIFISCFFVCFPERYKKILNPTNFLYTQEKIILKCIFPLKMIFFWYNFEFHFFFIYEALFSHFYFGGEGEIWLKYFTQKFSRRNNVILRFIYQRERDFGAFFYSIHF